MSSAIQHVVQVPLCPVVSISAQDNKPINVAMSSLRYTAKKIVEAIVEQ